VGPDPRHQWSSVVAWKWWTLATLVSTSLWIGSPASPEDPSWSAPESDPAAVAPLDSTTRLAGSRRLLVKLRTNEPDLVFSDPAFRQLASWRRLLAAPSAPFLRRGFDRLYVMEILDRPEGLDSRSARWLIEHPSVEYVQRDAETHTLSIPNDPFFADAWPLNNTGQTGGTPDADIDAVEAWDINKGGGVIVAVLDSGIDYDHPDLSANLWTNDGEIPGNEVDDDANGFVDDDRGWDFFNGDNDPFDDGSGHGTHVAGIVAGVQNNSIGISGVGPELRIMPLKIQSDLQVGSVSAAIEAVHYAAMMGASVLSNSWAVSAAWGEPDYDQPGFSPALREAILAASDVGALFVAAAGNSSVDLDNSLLFPASYNLENTITVAATDPDDQIAGFSNFGPLTVELGAPGWAITSTVPMVCRLLGPPPTTQTCDGSGYQSASGTSMAAPHVAAVLGMMRAVAPGLSHLELKSALLASTDPLPTLVGVTVSGGRLNAEKALILVPELGAQVATPVAAIVAILLVHGRRRLSARVSSSASAARIEGRFGRGSRS